MNNRLKKALSELKSLFLLILIILTIKVTIFEMYIVPTGSMENTIMTGDFLVGNRFVYGMRTPDRIGLMDFSTNLPSLKFYFLNLLYLVNQHIYKDGELLLRYFF